MFMVLRGINGFLTLLQWVLVAYCILSWFVDPRSTVMRFLTRVTDPILQPIRMLLFRSTNGGRLSMFAPIIAAFLIQLLRGLVMNLMYGFRF